MIKTELVCSKEYAKKLNEFLEEEDWENLVFISKRFESDYLKNMPTILNKIPFCTGFDWKKELCLPIYIVNYPGPSKTNPITIKIDSNKNMLIKLIHELSHINFPNKFGLNEKIYEDAINQTTEKISFELELGKCEALEKIICYRKELKKKGISVRRIPFESKNLKDYFLLKVV